jgi:hypothetical protein
VSVDDRNTPRPTLRGLNPPPAKNRSVQAKIRPDTLETEDSISAIRSRRPASERTARTRRRPIEMATIARVTSTPRVAVSATATRAARVSRPAASAIAVRGRDASKTVALGGRRETRRALTIVAAEGEDAPAPAAEPEAAAPAAPAVDPEAARIADMVDEIKDYMKLLYVKREMNFNEVRLTLAIEDPRLADRRERYGIEDESGVSADEKVEALELIDNGGVPTDALVVETLLADFRQWPGLDSEVRRDRSGSSRYAEIANQAAGIKTQIEDERRKLLMDDDDGDEKDGNPFGFLVLYGVSAVPIFITIAALSIMFVNSLQ